jgi:hypothetical protein
VRGGFLRGDALALGKSYREGGKTLHWVEKIRATRLSVSLVWRLQ